MAFVIETLSAPFSLANSISIAMQYKTETRWIINEVTISIVFQFKDMLKFITLKMGPIILYIYIDRKSLREYEPNVVWLCCSFFLSLIVMTRPDTINRMNFSCVPSKWHMSVYVFMRRQFFFLDILLNSLWSKIWSQKKRERNKRPTRHVNTHGNYSESKSGHFPV